MVVPPELAGAIPLINKFQVTRYACAFNCNIHRENFFSVQFGSHLSLAHDCIDSCNCLCLTVATAPLLPSPQTSPILHLYMSNHLSFMMPHVPQYFRHAHFCISPLSL
ncbi:hypothetical protein CsSME_00011896 [Camellia sinensis var. sinensis]